MKVGRPIYPMLISLAVLCTSLEAQTVPRTIFVDPAIVSGADAGGDCLGTYDPLTRSGGSGTGTAYNTLMEASLAATPGDTIEIRGGVYEGAQILRPQNSGSPGLPITYRNYNGEQVTIQNTNGLSDLTADEVNAGQLGRQYGIYVYGKSYLVIDGLRVTNVSGWARVVNCMHVTFKNCDFTYALSTGTTGSVRFLSSDYNQVLNSQFREGNDSLLLIHSDNNLIAGNTFVNGRHTLWCIRAGNFNVLRNNYFYNELQKIGEIYDAETDPPIMYDATKYNVVEGNVFAKTASSGNASPFAGIQFAGQRCIIRKNVFYETIGPALDLTYYANEALYNYENRIYHNVFYRTDFAGICIASSATLHDNIFKNNILEKSVFVANDTRWPWYTDQLAGKPVQLMIGRIGGFLFAGNDLFNVQAGEDHLITHGTRFDGYLTPPHNVAWWQTNYPSIFAQNLELNPGFVDEANHDYHLTASSPMIDAGVDLTATSSAGTGTQMPVADVKYFYSGYGIEGEQGDLIKLDSGQTARIVGIDYAGNVITLDHQLSWSSGEGVSLHYNGAAPDIGAFEYAGGSGPDTTPPGDVSGFTAMPGDSQISLSWTNPTDADLAGVKILRKTGNAPTGPTDGTLAYQGTGTSQIDTGLTNGTTYYYRAFTYDEVPNYSSGMTASGTPAAGPDTTPPGNVSGFTPTPGDSQISLTWTNPTDADFAGVKILRKIGSAPTGPTDGTVAYQGSGTNQVDTGLTNGTTYYFRAFAYDAVPNYSSGVTVSGTPAAGADITAPGDVSGLTATVGDGQISLTWANPTDADFAGVKILRKTGSAPTGPTDGTVSYQGTGTSQVDTGLANGATYYYGAFAYDAVPNYSPGVTISAVPQAADGTAPSVSDSYPGPDAVQAPLNPLIVLTISDAGSGIEAGTVTIQVNNQLVYSGGGSLYESASGTCRRTGTRASYHYYYQPANPFDFDQRVTVLVNASDATGNAMTPLSYQFTTQMRSFGQNQPVSAAGDASGHPAVATDSQGNLWAAWHAGAVNAREIYVAKRTSQLPSWGTALRLTSVASDRCHPALAIGPDDALYLVWQDNRRGNWDIYVSVSADGSTWGDPIRVSDSNDVQANPVIAVDQASPAHVYIAWERGAAGSRDIYLASCSTSFDSKTITQVTSDPADQMEPALAVGSDNTVYLLWTDQRNGSADLYGASSASSWSNVAVVAGSGQQSHPAVTAAPGTSTLHLVWQSDATGNLDVLYGTANGLPSSPLTGSSLIDDTTGADQSAPSILAARDHAGNVHVYACWQDNRVVGSTHDSDLYLAEIRAGTGGTNILVGDEGTNSHQSEPALGFDDYGQPVVLWTDSRGSTPRIYSAASMYFKPVALAAAVITRAAGGRVGVAPAAISTVTDVSIQIPASAYECDLAIRISQVQNLPKFTAVGLTGYEIGPSGVQFTFPATVTIPYTSSGSGRATPYWYDPQTGTLSQQGMTAITNQTLGNGIPLVSFQTSHLTTFVLLDNPLPNGGGGGGCAVSHAGQESIVGFLLPYAALVLFLGILKWNNRRGRKDSEETPLP